MSNQSAFGVIFNISFYQIVNRNIILISLRLSLFAPIILLSCNQGTKNDQMQTDRTPNKYDNIRYFKFDKDTFRLPESIRGQIFIRDFNIKKIAKYSGQSGKENYLSYFKGPGEKYGNEYKNSLLIRRFDEKNYESYNDNNWSLIKDALIITNDTALFSFSLPDTFPSKVEHLEVSVEVLYHLNPQYDTSTFETKDFFLLTK